MININIFWLNIWTSWVQSASLASISLSDKVKGSTVTILSKWSTYEMLEISLSDIIKWSKWDVWIVLSNTVQWDDNQIVFAKWNRIMNVVEQYTSKRIRSQNGTEDKEIQIITGVQFQVEQADGTVTSQTKNISEFREIISKWLTGWYHISIDEKR